MGKFMDIPTEEIKLTVEHPDKIMDCNSCGKVFYIKRFNGKGELLVMVEEGKGNTSEVKCFGWIQGVLYPS